MERSREEEDEGKQGGKRIRGKQEDGILKGSTWKQTEEKPRMRSLGEARSSAIGEKQGQRPDILYSSLMLM